MSLEDVVFLDCQTTGGSPKSHTILEWGWATKETTIVHLTSQEEEIPVSISRMTGITNDMLSEAKPFVDTWIENPPPVDKPWVIHYARFEKQFFCQASQTLIWPENVICTYELSKRLLPNLPSHSLRSVAGYFGCPLHRVKRTEDHLKLNQLIWESLCVLLKEREIFDFEGVTSLLVQKVKRQSKPRLYKLSEEKRLHLPEQPGVYLFKNSNEEILYIGKATNLKSRVNSYFRGRKTKGTRLNELRSQIADIQTLPTANPVLAALLETDLIKNYDPHYNQALREKQRSFNYMERGKKQYGPYNDGPMWETLQFLLQLLEGTPIDVEGDNGELIKAAIDVFYERLARHQRRDHQNVLTALFRDCVQYSHEKIRLSRLDLEEEDTDDVEEEEIAEEVALTPEDLARDWHHVIRAFVMRTHRLRWLQRFANGLLEWRDHQVAIEDGKPLELIKKPYLDHLPERDNDLLRYDRLNVFYTEILKLCRKKSAVTFTTSSGILDKEQLRRYAFLTQFLPEEICD